jgi:hypothetical protein
MVTLAVVLAFAPPRALSVAAFAALLALSRDSVLVLQPVNDQARRKMTSVALRMT